jgi:hypothetical protein
VVLGASDSDRDITLNEAPGTAGPA